MRWKYFFLFILVLILLNITLFTSINTNKIPVINNVNKRESLSSIVDLKYNLLNKNFGSSFIQSQYLDLNYSEKKYLENKFDSYIIEKIKTKNPSIELIRQIQNKTNITIINFNEYNIIITYLTEENNFQEHLKKIIKEYKKDFNITQNHYLFVANTTKLTKENIIFHRNGAAILDFWFLKNISCFNKESQKNGIITYFKFKAMKNVYPHFKDDINDRIKDNKKILNNIVLNEKDKFIYENNFKNDTESYIITYIKGYLIWNEINKKHNMTSMINNLNKKNCKILNEAYKKEEKKLLRQLTNSNI